MKLLHKRKPGQFCVFDYFDEKDGCWKPRAVIVISIRDRREVPLKVAKDDRRGCRRFRRGRWLVTCFDIARGHYRTFYSCRVRDLRLVEQVASGKTEAQARAYAEGYRDGIGPEVGVVFVKVDDARVTHGLNSQCAVLAVEKQRRHA